MRSRIILLLVLILPTVALGEPTETPEYLMSESMSLMDWGIFQAGKKMESFRDFNNFQPAFFPTYYSGGFARYDWDENRIVLLGLFYGNGTQDECTENLRKLKGAFTDDTWDEKEQRKAAERVLNGLFSHKADYQTKGRPRDVGRQLVHITIMEAHIITSQSEGLPKTTVKCKSTFKSSEVSIIAN